MESNNTCIMNIVYNVKCALYCIYYSILGAYDVL